MLEAGLPQRLIGSRTAEKIPLAGGFGDPLKGRASRRRLMMLMTKSGYTLRIALGQFAMMQEQSCHPQRLG